METAKYWAMRDRKTKSNKYRKKKVLINKDEAHEGEKEKIKEKKITGRR